MTRNTMYSHFMNPTHLPLSTCDALTCSLSYMYLLSPHTDSYYPTFVYSPPHLLSHHHTWPHSEVTTTLNHLVHHTHVSSSPSTNITPECPISTLSIHVSIVYPRFVLIILHSSTPTTQIHCQIAIIVWNHGERDERDVVNVIQLQMVPNFPGWYIYTCRCYTPNLNWIWARLTILQYREIRMREDFEWIYQTRIILLGETEMRESKNNNGTTNYQELRVRRLLVRLRRSVKYHLIRNLRSKYSLR
jgi:hypothetical protein